MSDPSCHCFEYQKDDQTIVISFTCPALLEHDVVQKTGDALHEVQQANEDCDLILCFAKVIALSSAAIGKLITLKRRVDRVEKRIILCSMEPVVKETFISGKLSEYFDITDTLEEAKAALA